MQVTRVPPSPIPTLKLHASPVDDHLHNAPRSHTACRTVDKRYRPILLFHCELDRRPPDEPGQQWRFKIQQIQSSAMKILKALGSLSTKYVLLLEPESQWNLWVIHCLPPVIV